MALRRWRILAIVALALPLVATTSCIFDSDDDDDNTPQDGEVMPLAVGNSWTYQYTTQSGQSTITLSVTGTQSVQGVEVARVEYAGEAYPEAYYALLRNGDNGLLFYGDAIFGELTTPDLWCKYPAAVGDTWQTSGQGATVGWQVIAVSETVTVPAGSFPCIHIRGTVTGGLSTADHWWSAGVGEVKLQTGSGLVWQLQAFDVN